MALGHKQLKKEPEIIDGSGVSGSSVKFIITSVISFHFFFFCFLFFTVPLLDYFNLLCLYWFRLRPSPDHSNFFSSFSSFSFFSLLLFPLPLPLPLPLLLLLLHLPLLLLPSLLLLLCTFIPSDTAFLLNLFTPL